MNDKKLATTKRGLWPTIFFSPDESRLRAGWRLLLHTIMFVILSTLVGTALFIPIGLLHISFDSQIALLFSELTMLAGITLSTFLARRFLDKRSMLSLGLKLDSLALTDILAGIVITFFQMGAIFGLEMVLGWTKFEGFAWKTQSGAQVAIGVGLGLFIFILTGWAEELLSRGYHLQTVESGLNMFWAVGISSSVFAILHISNPNATNMSTLGIFAAGLFLALPFVLTRQLWLSIGLHIGWNFFEGVVFGFPVSGTQTFQLMQHTVKGPELWTGGAFGPEAGLIVFPALLLGALLVFLYAKSEIRKTIFK